MKNSDLKKLIEAVNNDNPCSFGVKIGNSREIKGIIETEIDETENEIKKLHELHVIAGDMKGETLVFGKFIDSDYFLEGGTNQEIADAINYQFCI